MSNISLVIKLERTHIARILSRYIYISYIYISEVRDTRTKQQELDILGRLDAILLEILLDLLAASQSGPLFRGHGTAHLATRCLHKCHPHALAVSPAAAKQRGRIAAGSPRRR